MVFMLNFSFLGFDELGLNLDVNVDLDVVWVGLNFTTDAPFLFLFLVVMNDLSYHVMSCHAFHFASILDGGRMRMSWRNIVGLGWTASTFVVFSSLPSLSPEAFFLFRALSSGR